jgi:hypothetical protein
VLLVGAVLVLLDRSGVLVLVRGRFGAVLVLLDRLGEAVMLLDRFGLTFFLPVVEVGDSSSCSGEMAASVDDKIDFLVAVEIGVEDGVLVALLGRFGAMLVLLDRFGVLVGVLLAVCWRSRATV